MSQEGLDYSRSAEISNEADVPEVSLGVDESGEKTSGLDGSLESKDLPSGGDGAETHKKYSDAYETPETSGDQVEVHEEEPPVGDYSKAYEPAPDAKDDAQKVEAPTDSVEELGQKGSCADGPASLDQEAAKEPVSDVPLVEGGKQPEQMEPQREDAFARIDSTEDGSRDIPPVKEDAAALDAQKAKAPTAEQDAFESTKPADDTLEPASSAHDVADEAVDGRDSNLDTPHGKYQKWVETPELKDIKKELKGETRERYVENAKLARNNRHLRSYTDHGFRHQGQVMEAAPKVSSALSEGIARGKLDDKVFSEKTVPKDFDAAAALHDTGLGGDDLIAYDRKAGKITGISGDERSIAFGKTVRKNHPLNSALYALQHRESLENQGINVDKVAAECFVHSKSASGIYDLTRASGKGSWDEAFSILDDAVSFHNEKHPGNEISFDRNAFDLRQTRTEALALRISDANRCTDFPGSLFSGERLQAPSLKKGLTVQDAYAARGIKEEAQCYDLMTDSGRKIPSNSKVFLLGEGNVSRCSMTFDKGENKFKESIFIHDGSAYPRCTQRSISDRLGEIGTAHSPEAFFCDVNFGSSIPAEGSPVRAKYDRWARRVRSSTGISVRLPWSEAK